MTFPRNLHVNALNQVTSFLHTKPYRQYNVMFALQVNTSLPHWFLLIVSLGNISFLSINNHWPHGHLGFYVPSLTSSLLYISFTLNVPTIASRRTLRPPVTAETSEQLLKLKQPFLTDSPGNWLQCVWVQRWLQGNNTLIPYKRSCCLGAGNVSECRERGSGDGLQLLGYVV